MSITSDIVPIINTTSQHPDIQNPNIQNPVSEQTEISIEDENIANIDEESNGYIEKLNYDIGGNNMYIVLFGVIFRHLSIYL